MADDMILDDLDEVVEKTDLFIDNNTTDVVQEGDGGIQFGLTLPVMEQQPKYATSDSPSERVYYLVKAKELKSSEMQACGYMRSAVQKYEGPKDFIKGFSRDMFTEMSRAGQDYPTSWSKVISDGEYIIMYKGISN